MLPINLRGLSQKTHCFGSRTILLQNLVQWQPCHCLLLEDPHSRANTQNLGCFSRAMVYMCATSGWAAEGIEKQSRRVCFCFFFLLFFSVKKKGEREKNSMSYNWGNCLQFLKLHLIECGKSCDQKASSGQRDHAPATSPSKSGHDDTLPLPYLPKRVNFEQETGSLAEWSKAID